MTGQDKVRCCPPPCSIGDFLGGQDFESEMKLGEDEVHGLWVRVGVELEGWEAMDCRRARRPF